MTLQLVRSLLVVLPGRWRRGWLGLAALVAIGALTELITATAVFALLGLVSGAPRGATPGDRLGFLAGLPGVEDPLLAVLLLAAIMLLIRNALAAAGVMVQAHVVAGSVAAAFERLVAGITAAPLRFHLRTTSAELLHQSLRATEGAYRVVVASAVGVLAESLVTLCLAAALFLLAPGATLVAMVTIGGGTLLTLRLVGRRMTRAGAASYDAERAVLRDVGDIVGSIRNIKTGGRESAFVAFALASHRRFTAAVRRSVALAGLPRPVIETLFLVVATSGFLLLRESGVSGARSVALLGAFAYAGFRCLPSAHRVHYLMGQIRREQPAAWHLAATLDELAPHRLRERPHRNFRFARAIELRDVTFVHQGTTRPALSGVSLRIRHGELVGVVGANGSGKSTLLDVLGGLLEPDSGAVLVDGRALHEWLAYSPPLIGLVPQVVHLLDGTLERNVALGGEPIDRLAFERATRVARLEALLAADDGSPVGESGRRLSGGERQRVAVARGLYDDPEVLLLDEATSALDPQTTDAVMGWIRAQRGRKTIVLATQDLDSVLDCDQVVVLADGEVVDSGAPAELAARSLAFRRLSGEGASSARRARGAQTVAGVD